MDAYSFINEEELSNLIVEIVNYSDKINDVLSKYDNEFAKLKDVYEGKPYDDLNNYFNTFVRPNFLTIKKNIISYSDDLTYLIRKMHENNFELKKLFVQYTDDLIARKNAVEEIK